MLEQYRKDYPAEDNDILPNSQTPLSRKRLIVILTGATCALFLLLFVMGIFRSEDDIKVASSGGDSVISQENSGSYASSYERQIQSLQARIDKLEAEVYAKSQTTQNTIPSPERAFFEEQPVATAPLLNTTEEAAFMTDQALRNYISHEEKQTYVAVEEAPVTKKVKETVVAAKASTESGVYVVQRGDTLSKISQRFFGTPNRWRSVYEANKEKISNINKLKVGTKLVIPQK